MNQLLSRQNIGLMSRFLTRHFLICYFILGLSIFLWFHEVSVPLFWDISYHPSSTLSMAGFLYFLLLLLRDFFIVPHLLLPSITISHDPEYREMTQQMKDEFFAYNASASASVLIATPDGVRLDAVTWRNPSSPDNRWIVWLCANGFHYETLLDFLQTYALALNASFVGFSYRAVGSSDFVIPGRFADLVTDAEAVVDHLVRVHGAAPENILLHGHSMGGAVGAYLRARRAPQGPLVSDRSFDDLPRVAKELFLSSAVFARVLTLLLGAVLHLLLVPGLDIGWLWALFFLPFTAYAYAFVAARQPAWLECFLPVFFALIGWNPRVARLWGAFPLKNKVVVASEADPIIRWPSSLWYNLSAEAKQGTSLISVAPRSPNDGPIVHSALLIDFENTWKSFVNTIQEIF